MKKVFLFLLSFFMLLSSDSFAQKSKSYKAKTVRVKGYTTKKGKYVKPHYRSKKSSFILFPELYFHKKRVA